ncbi:hypothetical protein ACMU9U_000821 [Yersinia enterocolitica]|nr:hypothetical protein [Yersinia enterocolitica]EKN5985110.1 hypothetical protein [Yersinia enterocolitica]EKN5988337.1 hypothetical protein [Yersinia enterocolitica]ELX2243223.1 hypothetical protein [Yersinia enterocolitica]HDL6715520.1 hypothetical protein [Yersinia enterocolitica]
MKTLLIICMSTVLLFNMTASYAASPVHQEMQKSSSENCKRPPEPPKDKNGHPLPPPKDHNNSHASKGQPPHDDKHLCPPPQGNKKP